MTVSELIDRLQKLPADYEVMVENSAAGSGPQDVQSAKDTTISQSDANNCGECEGRVGERIVLLSFGSY
jgi:hypothetical protein